MATLDRGVKQHDVKFWCEQHCPVHGAQQMMERAEPAKTIACQQEDLFS